MAESLQVEKPITVDLLDVSGTPALHSTSDMPVVESKPDVEVPAASQTEPEVEKTEDKTISESATEPGAEPPASDKPKEAKGVQKRLDELVRQREEERAEKLRLLAIVEQLQKPKEAVTEPEPVVDDTEPVRPNRANYDDPNVYEEALIDYVSQLSTWQATQLIKQREAADVEAAKQREIDEGQRKVTEAYTARVETFKAKTPDYTEVAESPNVTIPTLAAMAIVHSEHAPEIQYYLGKNPDVAEKLFELSPPQMLMELGKIDASLSANVQPHPAISAAPRPIKPIIPASEVQTFDPEQAGMEEYAANRRKVYGYADPQKRH